MKKTILLLVVTTTTMLSFAQKKKITTSATINFDAITTLDALPKADNKTVVASINTKNGEVAFESIIKSFSFTNPTIQDHFNGAKWMDSEKFPKATFKGKITNLVDVNFKVDGSYNAIVTGNLTIHGVTKPITTNAIIVVKEKAVTTTAEFSIKLADYNVDGAAIAAGKVAKEPKITVTAFFK
ncbi:MAG: YceI family protein [Ferruginibacter sp.]|nr:YceI family protein [Ferruginibacter sp.]